MADYIEKYTNGLYYRVYGAGEPLVLLHGFLGSGRDFNEIIDGLSGSYKILVPDLPGFGNSREYEVESAYDVQAMTDALCFMLGSEGVFSVDMLGYSMGGRIALSLAAQERSPVKKLVLLSADPGEESEDSRKARARLDKERADQIATEGMHDFLDFWYSAKLFAPLKQHKSFKEIHSWRLLENDAKLAARVIKDMSPGTIPHMWDALKEITTPLLYLYGELDEKYANVAERMSPLNALIEVAGIDEAGHALQVEAPAEVVRAVKKFL